MSVLELKYTCRYCGRQAIIGKHRCLRERIAKLGRRPAASRGAGGSERDPDADLREGYKGPERKPSFNVGRTVVLTAVIATSLLVAFTLLVAGYPLALLLLLVPVLLLIRGRGSVSSRARYRRLVWLCRGDHDVAERLIVAELRRNPDDGRNAAIDIAVTKLEMDRR